MFEKLLEEFKKLPATISDENFFSICGFPHYERVASNILQFFLDSKREHGLSDLFVRSLLSFRFNDESLPTDYFAVSKEQVTQKGNFIDLVLKSENLCVVVENKIYAWVYNDLDDYYSWAKSNATDVAAFVLSLQKQPSGNNEWIYVTYNQLFEKIKANIGLYMVRSNPRYLSLCLEFIENIESLSGGPKMDIEFAKFLMGKKSEVVELLAKTDQLRNDLRRRVQNVGNLVVDRVNDNRLKQWTWRENDPTYDVAVSDLKLTRGTLAVHTELHLAGWKFVVFSRNNMYPLRQLETTLRLLGFNGEVRSDRLELGHQFDLATEDAAVADFTFEIVSKLLSHEWT